MAEQTGFFSNGDYYNQDVFSAFIADCISTGVVQTVDSALAVTQYSTPAMSVNISLGRAYINGFYFAVVGEASTRPITAANASNPRIDRVVLGLSPTEAQSITLYVKAGTPAASPVPPTLSRTDELYEISLAQVRIVGVLDETVKGDRGNVRKITLNMGTEPADIRRVIRRSAKAKPEERR